MEPCESSADTYVATNGSGKKDYMLAEHAGVEEVARWEHNAADAMRAVRVATVRSKVWSLL